MTMLPGSAVSTYRGTRRQLQISSRHRRRPYKVLVQLWGLGVSGVVHLSSTISVPTISLSVRNGQTACSS